MAAMQRPAAAAAVPVLQVHLVQEKLVAQVLQQRRDVAAAAAVQMVGFRQSGLPEIARPMAALAEMDMTEPAVVQMATQPLRGRMVVVAAALTIMAVMARLVERADHRSGGRRPLTCRLQALAAAQAVVMAVLLVAATLAVKAASMAAVAAVQATRAPARSFLVALAGRALL